MRAAQCEGKGDVLLFEQGLDAAAVRKEADRILDVCGGICAVLSLDETGGRYAVGQRNGNVRELIGEIERRSVGKRRREAGVCAGIPPGGKRGDRSFLCRPGIYDLFIANVRNMLFTLPGKSFKMPETGFVSVMQ